MTIIDCLPSFLLKFLLLSYLTFTSPETHELLSTIAGGIKGVSSHCDMLLDP